MPTYRDLITAALDRRLSDDAISQALGVLLDASSTALASTRTRVNELFELTSVAGTNTITGTMTPDLTAYSYPLVVIFTPANTNTGATTLNIDSLGALDIVKANNAALIAGDLVAGIPALLVLDSGADDFMLMNPQKGIGVSSTWTPVIRGSGTAGTYQIATNNSRYTRMGRRVHLDVFITLAGAITGGGTGGIQIDGVPFSKIANTYPLGNVQTDGVDFDGGASLSLSFSAVAASSALILRESFDNAAASAVLVSGLLANDTIIGSISYETDDA